MRSTNQYHRIFLTALLAINLSIAAYGQSDSLLSPVARYNSYLNFFSLINNVFTRPNWYKDGNRFWLSEGEPNNTCIYVVDPLKNTKKLLFDTARVRLAIKSLLGQQPTGKGLPFADFQFVKEDNLVKFKIEEKTVLLNLKNYEAKFTDASEVINESEQLSPDKKQVVYTKENNVWLRTKTTEKTEQLTVDGIQDNEWIIPPSAWSPNGTKVFVRKSDVRNVHHLPIINYASVVEEVNFSTYAKVGKAIEKSELFIIDVASKKALKLDVGTDEEQYVFPLGWRPDGSEVIFMRLNRIANKLELLVANVSTGISRIILKEENKTFVGGLDFITDDWQRQFTLLNDGNRFIWLSERDGWKHFYLYEMSGKLIQQLTQGTFPVVELVKTDEKRGWIYFKANAEQNPYYTNLYRVDFRGKNFRKLTAASGAHHIQFSPAGDCFLDIHSTSEQPPLLELRSANGKLLQVLKTTNIELLKKVGWNPPENFNVKAADGKTDIYGIIYKPADFDSNKKYPVVEFIYAGPQMKIVPTSFYPNTSLSIQAQALAQLGYITFLVDGRGTPGRSKIFQDAFYREIGKYEILDHTTALKEIAASRPYMDLKRVGIMGHSWGGYFAIRAMLLAPDVYSVGIASAPGEITEGAEIMEPYMDLPQHNKINYDFATNNLMANNLSGKLLFIHGTSDIHAPFSTTVRMIDALIKWGKPYDLLLLPEQTHFFNGMSEKYVNEKIKKYFEENLKGLK